MMAMRKAFVGPVATTVRRFGAAAGTGFGTTVIHAGQDQDPQTGVSGDAALGVCVEKDFEGWIRQRSEAPLRRALHRIAFRLMSVLL